MCCHPVIPSFRQTVRSEFTHLFRHVREDTGGAGNQKMSMTDPIADMLTRIRNACGSKHRRVDMPVSKMKTEVARILKENDFIQDYSTVEGEDGRKLLRVRLKYAAGGQPVIRELQRVSTPGL